MNVVAEKSTNIVREKREAANLTQEQLAEKVGVIRTHITNIEAGRFRPSIQVAKAIARELDFDWTLIFEEEGE